jgi:hypothetical protein
MGFGVFSTYFNLLFINGINGVGGEGGRYSIIMGGRTTGILALDSCLCWAKLQ